MGWDNDSCSEIALGEPADEYGLVLSWERHNILFQMQSFELKYTQKIKKKSFGRKSSQSLIYKSVRVEMEWKGDVTL